MTVNTLVSFQTNSLATYCTVASCCMLLYDFLLTLGQEIELIWPARWNLGKILFFATRYPPLVDGAILLYHHTAPASTSPALCSLLFRLSGSLIVGGIVIAELVLVFRTWAVWGQRNKFLRIVFGLLSASAIPVAYSSYKAFAHVEFSPSPYPHLQGCWITINPHSILYLDYVIIVIFESAILGLTVYKGWQILRFNTYTSSLVSTLYRDGILYYLYLIGASLVNILVIVTMPPPQPSLILMQRVLHSIFTARILLNLREAADRDRVKMTTSAPDSCHPDSGRTDTALSSVILGVDTWFRNTTQSGMQPSAGSELAAV